MNAPKKLRSYLDGKLPLPAGFVPLAAYVKDQFILGILPNGNWIRLLGTAPVWQRQSMEVVIATLGGTSAKAAAAIGVSPRTVESWRCGRKRLTVERAYEIARAMANL